MYHFCVMKFVSIVNVFRLIFVRWTALVDLKVDTIRLLRDLFYNHLIFVQLSQVYGSKFQHTFSVHFLMQRSYFFC